MPLHRNGPIAGDLALAFDSIALKASTIAKVERAIARHTPAVRGLDRLVNCGVDKTQLLRSIVQLGEDYQAPQHPAIKTRNRQAYESSLRILKRELPDCRQRIEHWISPLFESAGWPIDDEGRAAHLLAGAAGPRMAADLQLMLSTMHRVEAIVIGLANRKPTYIRRSIQSWLFNSAPGALAQVRTARSPKELRNQLELICRWVSGSYRGKQLCAALSPVLTAAFEALEVEAEYPRTPKSLRTFMARKSAAKKTTTKRSPK